MCKTLLVLNAVRNHEIGIPLSIQQYKLLTTPVLVGRLTNANRHLVALRISEYLNLNTEVVIRHWACTKITASSAIHDAALLEILLKKLKLCKDISYAAIAAHADKSGRRKLAAVLVDHEPRSFQQDVAFLLLKESWEIERNPVAARGSALQGPRLRLFEDAQRLFSQTKEHSFEAKATEEHAKLLRLQLELEASTKQAIFVGSSISDTIRTCIVLGNHRAAMRVRSEFKVSEKRWYWLKAFALATVRDWDALEKFSKEKKPPGGYKPFVEACIDAGEKTEALKYIPKLTDPGEKSQAFARIGMDKEAADAASQAKDSELFGRWKLTLAQNSGTASIFDTLRDRLSFQGVY